MKPVRVSKKVWERIPSKRKGRIGSAVVRRPIDIRGKYDKVRTVVGLATDHGSIGLRTLLLNNRMYIEGMNLIIGDGELYDDSLI